MIFLDFRSASYLFIVILRFVQILSSTSLLKNKKIQALVKFYVFLTQKFECTLTLKWPLLFKLLPFVFDDNSVPSSRISIKFAGISSYRPPGPF